MTKLTANKNLRVRKIFGCIEDNLKIEVDRESMGLPPDDTNKGQKMELLCQDVVLNPRHTIATVKKYFWKTGGDICITYRSST